MNEVGLCTECLRLSGADLGKVGAAGDEHTKICEILKQVRQQGWYVPSLEARGFFPSQRRNVAKVAIEALPVTEQATAVSVGGRSCRKQQRDRLFIASAQGRLG